MTRRSRVLLAGCVSAVVTMAAASVATTPLFAQQQQSQQEPQQEQVEQPPEPAPDLRIVRIEVTPSPLRQGNPGTVRVLLHNLSSVVITGSIVVEVAHDRATPQPFPLHREVYYLDPDALTEVEFELPAVTIDQSPYTFFATVDRSDVIDEEDEVNNTTWERVAVCESPEVEEVADGVDNDCDGMSDEGLGLTAAPGAAVRMLRELQRQAALDRVPLIYAMARLFAPQSVESSARLETEEGDFVGLRARAGSEPSAEFTRDAPNAQLVLVDWNGGELESGDLVSLRARDAYLLAESGGGGAFVARARFREQERLFSLVRIGAPADGTESGVVPSDDRIRSGDLVAFRASTGHFLSAEQGGGGRLRADRGSAAGWESFTITLREDEEIP